MTEAVQGKAGYDVGVTEAALRLGVTAKYVYDLLRARRLEAVKVGRVWMISRESVNVQKRKMLHSRPRRIS